MQSVMLVDDELWCLAEIADLLVETGRVKNVALYQDARKALESVDEDKPDVAFIDVVMPGMTGLELAKKLKEQIPGLWVVLLSENESYARHGFDLGVNDFILKPVRLERVRKAIERSGLADCKQPQ